MLQKSSRLMGHLDQTQTLTRARYIGLRVDGFRLKKKAYRLRIFAMNWTDSQPSKIRRIRYQPTIWAWTVVSASQVWDHFHWMTNLPNVDSIGTRLRLLHGPQTDSSLSVNTQDYFHNAQETCEKTKTKTKTKQNKRKNRYGKVSFI